MKSIFYVPIFNSLDCFFRFRMKLDHESDVESMLLLLMHRQVGKACKYDKIEEQRWLATKFEVFVIEGLYFTHWQLTGGK